ncbi:MAG: hypothetical protein ACLGGX_02290 [Bdellovibrionia bacterium]
MTKLLISLLLLSATLSSGCSHLMTRSHSSGYGGDQAMGSPVRYIDNRSGKKNQIYDPNFERTAYELGFNPQQGLNASDQQKIHDRMRVRELEKRLGSFKEREQYSKILPWLESDQERIEMLSIPTLEGRQAWINRNKIWNRAKAPDTQVKELIDTQDIAIGMPQEFVRKSWGDPQNVEYSGNPIYRNERWKYVRQISSPDGYRREVRYVYFEGGKVVGWETN